LTPSDPPLPPDREPPPPPASPPEEAPSSASTAAPPDRGDAWYSSGAGSADPPELPSWERRETLGVFRAALATLREVLFDAGETFYTARRTGDFASPFLFTFLMGLTFGLLACAMRLFMLSASSDVDYGPMFDQFSEVLPAEFVDPLRDIVLDQQSTAGEALSSPAFIASEVSRSILRSLLGPFILAGIVHFFLLVLGAASYEYEASYRAVAYCHASASVLLVIPFCGGFLYFIWLPIILVIALGQMHEAGLMRPTIALVMAFFLNCCALFFGVGFI
jgi:hypothetical protein